MNVTDHEKFTHQASWSELLGDTIEWLPRPIAQDFHKKISMKCISQPIEASSFLRIIMCIKEGDLEAALKWINSTYETSRFPGALFLLRARVHFLLDQYEPMEQCLIAAQEVGEDLDQVLATTSELRDLLLKKIEPSQSAAICCDFNESEGDQDLTSGNTNPSMGDKGSCLKQEEQELLSIRFQDSTNTSLDFIEHTGSRSLLKKRVSEFSSATTQVSYPSEANTASLVTLFCAVYHRDENRHALIEEHLENIKSQSLPVEPIYVFEAGDQPSSAAKPYSIVSPSRLSIYQAWYTAMEHSNKKLLINLNLDDRLCPDAVTKMSRYFDSDDVMLVGGEWVIANQVAKSDQLRNIFIEETYFDPAWPPKTCSFTRSGENLRLGSGTGERGTYGPATMFRRSLLEELPYPLKFGNGDLVESIADSLWWSLIKRKYPGGAIRIPEIVGIYHSDPSSQAEFRVTNEWEKLQKWGLM